MQVFLNFHCGIKIVEIVGYGIITIGFRDRQHTEFLGCFLTVHGCIRYGSMRMQMKQLGEMLAFPNL